MEERKDCVYHKEDDEDVVKVEALSLSLTLLVVPLPVEIIELIPESNLKYALKFLCTCCRCRGAPPKNAWKISSNSSYS